MLLDSKFVSFLPFYLAIFKLQCITIALNIFEPFEFGDKIIKRQVGNLMPHNTFRNNTVKKRKEKKK
jgi:hypothetical protein